MAKSNTKVALAKTIAKKKQNLVLTSNYTISTRRQSYQQKTLRKTFSSLSSSSHVSLRNRIISITSLKPDKIKIQESLKKKAEKSEHIKQNKSSTPKSSPEKSNPKQNTVTKPSKEDLISDLIKSTNSETGSKNQTPKLSLVKTKSISKAEEGSSNICRTRSSTIRQQKSSTVTTKKLITLKTKNNQPTKSFSSSKKTKVDGFEFSSDDDEPLYKKLASDSRLDENEVPDNKEKKESGAHFTRSKIKEKGSPEKQASNNKNINKIIDKTVSSSRVTRQNVSKNVSSSKIITKLTRSKSLINKFSTSKQTISNIKSINSLNSKIITKKTNSPLKKISEIKKAGSEQQPVQQNLDKIVPSKSVNNLNENLSDKNDIKTDVSLKMPLTSDSSKPCEVKLEKSFSESDDEPLAAKLIETTKNILSDSKKSLQLKINKNEINMANSANLTNGEKSDSVAESVIENKTKGVNISSNNTNPVPSYEESLKIFGIAHRNTDEKLSATQYVKLKNCNQRNNKEKDPVTVEKKHEFRGNYENPVMLNKNDLKNRPSRKFMKPKEYIEQWLKDSARPFANRAIINSPDFANNDSSNTDKTLKSNECFDVNNTQSKPVIGATPITEKRLTANNKCDAANTIKNDENTVLKNSNLEPVNIYDFESEPELVASPPRKTKLIKEPMKRLDKTRPKYNMADNLLQSNNMKLSEPTQINDLLSNKMSHTFSGFPIEQNENENKSMPTESIGNVISTAIIVSLEPNEEIPTKDFPILIDNVDHEKKFVSSKNINNIYIDKFSAAKENTEFSLQSFNRLNLNQTDPSNMNIHYNNLQQFQSKPGFVSCIDKSNANQHYPVDGFKNLEYISRIDIIANKNFNSQQLDSFKTKHEFTSVANSAKNLNTPASGIQMETNVSNPSSNFLNNLDFTNDLFTLQSRKDFVFNSNIKNIPLENLTKNIQPAEHQKQNFNNIHNVNVVDYQKNTNMLNDTLELSNVKTSALKEKDMSVVNNDLTQSNSCYSLKNSVPNSSEFDKPPMYGMPHASSMQLIIPKYDHLKSMYTSVNKLNTNLLSGKNTTMSNRPEKLMATLGLPEKSNFEDSPKKHYNKTNDLFPFVFKTDKKRISDQNVNHNSDFEMNVGDQTSISAQDNIPRLNDNAYQYLKKVQDNLAISSPLNQVPINNLFNKNSLLNQENKGFEQSNDNSKPNLSLMFNKNLSMSAENMMPKICPQSFDQKPLKLNNIENKNKFTPLSQIKSISIGETRGTESISSISLKNFRLSTGMPNLNKPIPDMKNSLSSNLLSLSNPQTRLKKLNKSPNDKTNTNESQNVNDDPKTITTNSPKPKESEDHLFYIPLQGVSKTGANISNHLIEGVAVKMDTQGPNGPQQRVMMRAKLVRKSQINKNVNKNADKNTGPILEMVRSVREAFPEATIHSDNLPEVTQSKSKRVTKSNSLLAAKKPMNSKEKAVKSAAVNAVNCKASSCSSQSSQSTSKRATLKTTVANETINHINVTSFPQMEDQARVVEAPVFQPTEKEFQVINSLYF